MIKSDAILNNGIRPAGHGNIDKLLTKMVVLAALNSAVTESFSGVGTA